MISTAMTQEEIRAHFAADPAVRVAIAAEGDGSPAIAWGDTFVYTCDERGEPKKMPFVTIVTKDYVGFDEESKLNRGGLHRLNIEVGKAKFQELFGFAPKELDAHRAAYDFADLDRLFPHPVYGTHGWVSIINPSEASRESVARLLNLARDRLLERAK